MEVKQRGSMQRRFLTGRLLFLLVKEGVLKVDRDILAIVSIGVTSSGLTSLTRMRVTGPEAPLQVMSKGLLAVIPA
jgi:hypothetical protein